MSFEAEGSAENFQTDAKVALAKVIWRIENNGAIPEGSEEKLSAFGSVKQQYLAKAEMATRVLEAMGYAISPSAKN